MRVGWWCCSSSCCSTDENLHGLMMNSNGSVRLMEMMCCLWVVPQNWKLKKVDGDCVAWGGSVHFYKSIISWVEKRRSVQNHFDVFLLWFRYRTIKCAVSVLGNVFPAAVVAVVVGWHVTGGGWGVVSVEEWCREVSIYFTGTTIFCVCTITRFWYMLN